MCVYAGVYRVNQAYLALEPSQHERGEQLAALDNDALIDLTLWREVHGRGGSMG